MRVEREIDFHQEVMCVTSPKCLSTNDKQVPIDSSLGNLANDDDGVKMGPLEEAALDTHSRAAYVSSIAPGSSHREPNLQGANGAAIFAYVNGISSLKPFEREIRVPGVTPDISWFVAASITRAPRVILLQLPAKWGSLICM